jgi:periplasmic protein TonB
MLDPREIAAGGFGGIQMRRATADRIDHAVTAGAVLAAHLLLVWIAIQVRVDDAERDALVAPEPVVATLIQRPRNLAFGLVPVHVTTYDVLRLQRFAPKIPDIPVDEPEPAAISEALPQPASAPATPASNNGLAGDSINSSGLSGGGQALKLVLRVVPKYPPRSAERHEEGATRVHIRVDESGRVVDTEVVGSSGHRRLDGAAIAAVRRWKFARLPAGTAPQGTWLATEVRFVLYRFAYSRLGDEATSSVYEEEIKPGASDAQTPGSAEALSRFIADVTTGNLARYANDEQIAKMRAALEEWGEARSMRFTGNAGGTRWIRHEIGQTTVEVQWNKFEVHHEHATSEWLIAVDREGTVWSARATRALWR